MLRFRLHAHGVTTVLFGVAGALLFTPAFAFNPTDGAAAPYPQALPDTSVLYGATATAQPPPAPPALVAANSTAPPGYISPLPPMQLPLRPLYPTNNPQPVGLPAAPITATAVPAQPVVITPPQYLPASAPPAVAYIPAEPVPTGTLAPPVNVPSSVTPVAVPAAVVTVPPPVVAQIPAAPATTLSEQTRAILSSIPSHVDAQKPTKGGEVTVNRVSPEISAILGDKPKEDQFESVGLSIKVRRPGLDTNYELNRAYTSLMGGDTEQAIDVYKQILSSDPKNEDALFGLAATYHRLGEINKARPLYGMLLKLNPNHREGLNNFLVLVGDESPQDALPELERLEQRNPDFSPIPAQTAVVMDKLGYTDQARDKMLRAIELSPDNLTYKYNLAIMLDRQGRYADASALYKLLIDASLRGEKVPATVDIMQKRLNYITTASTSVKAAGG